MRKTRSATSWLDVLAVDVVAWDERRTFGTAASPAGAAADAPGPHSTIGTADPGATHGHGWRTARSWRRAVRGGATTSGVRGGRTPVMLVVRVETWRRPGRRR